MRYPIYFSKHSAVPAKWQQLRSVPYNSKAQHNAWPDKWIPTNIFTPDLEIVRTLDEKKEENRKNILSACSMDEIKELCDRSDIFPRACSILASYLEQDLPFPKLNEIDDALPFSVLDMQFFGDHSGYKSLGFKFGSFNVFSLLSSLEYKMSNPDRDLSLTTIAKLILPVPLRNFLFDSYNSWHSLKNHDPDADRSFTLQSAVQRVLNKVVITIDNAHENHNGGQKPPSSTNTADHRLYSYDASERQLIVFLSPFQDTADTDNEPLPEPLRILQEIFTMFEIVERHHRTWQAFSPYPTLSQPDPTNNLQLIDFPQWISLWQSKDPSCDPKLSEFLEQLRKVVNIAFRRSSESLCEADCPFPQAFSHRTLSWRYQASFFCVAATSTNVDLLKYHFASIELYPFTAAEMKAKQAVPTCAFSICIGDSLPSLQNLREFFVKINPTIDKNGWSMGFLGCAHISSAFDSDDLNLDDPLRQRLRDLLLNGNETASPGVLNWVEMLNDLHKHVKQSLPSCDLANAFALLVDTSLKDLACDALDLNTGTYMDTSSLEAHRGMKKLFRFVSGFLLPKHETPEKIWAVERLAAPGLCSAIFADPELVELYNKHCQLAPYWYFRRETRLRIVRRQPIDTASLAWAASLFGTTDVEIPVCCTAAHAQRLVEQVPRFLWNWKEKSIGKPNPKNAPTKARQRDKDTELWCLPQLFPRVDYIPHVAASVLPFELNVQTCAYATHIVR